MLWRVGRWEGRLSPLGTRTDIATCNTAFLQSLRYLDRNLKERKKENRQPKGGMGGRHAGRRHHNLVGLAEMESRLIFFKSENGVR